MLERFSATVEKLYAAAAGHCRWEEALVALEDLTGSAGAVIDLIPKKEGLSGTTLAGSFTAENCAEYARDYQSICPRIRYAVERGGLKTQFDYLFMTERAMDRDPVYEWFGKHGLRYHLGAPVTETPNLLGFVSLQRTRRQGHADAADVELFEMLRPHVSRAASLADQLGTLRSHQRFSSAMVEALPQAVFALDGAGALLFANAAGSRLLAADDGLRVEAGQLRTPLAADQQRLDAMVRSAIVPLGGRGAAWLRLARRSGKCPYAAFVAPLEIGDDEPLAIQAKVLVLVHDTAEQRCADAAMLVSLYGLTETQARLASALSGGHSIESAAALLRMAPATARSHLKHVFRKLGVNRQQDLIRLLATLPAVVITP